MLSGMYIAPFDVSVIGPGTLTLSTSGKPDVVVSLATLTSGGYTRFWHYNGAGGSGWLVAQDRTGDNRLTTEAAYSLDVALTTALQAEATVQGWTTPSNLTASFRRDNSPIGYRLRYTGSTITAAWSNSTGRALMGFSANVSTPAETLLADQVPTYCVVPTLEYTSDDTMNYEPRGSASHIAADDNSASYGVARYVAPMERDWVQQFETKAKTDRLSADSAHPWTFQHLFEYCRGEIPFGVVYYRSTADGGEVFMLREPVWHPERASAGNDAQFHIQFMTRVIGDMEV